MPVEDGEQKILDAVSARDADMRQRLRTWANVNSGTFNIEGVARMREMATSAFAEIADDVQVRPLPPRQAVTDRGEIVEQSVGDAVVFTKRSDAPRRALLCGHLDTVFAADSPFQQVREVDANTWNGPGVADMKGGIIVMLEALRVFESHAAAQELGWTVVLNADEEIGSPCSVGLLQELARQHEVGLVYEPALADGQLAGARGGAANFDLIIRGRSAHVGRNFEEGRSAIHVAAETVGVLASLNAAKGVTVNVGRIDGGGPANQVADLAVIRMNVRVADVEKQQAIENDLRRLVAVLNRRDGISAEIHGRFFSPPKPLEGATAVLFDNVRAVGGELGLDISWKATGGVCDGNKIQAVGLPTVDTLGVRGGNLHSHDEFVLLDSLVERAQLSALLLIRLAGGEMSLE